MGKRIILFCFYICILYLILEINVFFFRNEDKRKFYILRGGIMEIEFYNCDWEEVSCFCVFCDY